MAAAPTRTLRLAISFAFMSSSFGYLCSGIELWRMISQIQNRDLAPTGIHRHTRHTCAATLQWLDVVYNEPRACPRDPAGCRAGIAGLEWGLLRLVEAHAGAAQTRRQSEMTSCRIIMLEQSAVSADDNWLRCWAFGQGSPFVFRCILRFQLPACNYVQ